MLVGLALLAVLLFVPAGTWQFYQDCSKFSLSSHS